MSTWQMTASQELGVVLQEAIEAERANRPEDAIRIVEALLSGSKLSSSNFVTAWNVLGLSYTDEERFNEARAAFEKAISAFKVIPEPEARSMPNGLADLLSNLADVYSQTNQLDAALHLRLKALSAYQEANNFAGIARSYANLAGIELSEGHLRPAKKYLAEGYCVLPKAANMGADDRAMFYTIRAWAFEREKDYPNELSSYEAALHLWQDQHGNDYGMSGWAHMLLGNSYLHLNDLVNAKKEMQAGLSIIKRAFGEHSVRYLTAELAYSRVLDKTGARDAAKNLRQASKTELSTLFSGQCPSCLVSVDALH